MPTPELQAWKDWADVGEFNPDQYSDSELRARYESEALKIERQWDNQP